MGVVTQEIRHGRFMRYLFDPQRPHGFGSECLRGLMSAAASALAAAEVAPILPLDVHLMELDTASVPQHEYKSIDILVEVPSVKLVVAIELKIDASEHSGQLQRYKNVVETDWPASEGWRHIFLFLTKRGDSPSEEHGLGWTALPLERVVQELEAVFERGSGFSNARGFLKQYTEMLRRRHLSDDRLEELARKLWSEHAEALSFLSDRRPDLRGSILGAILDSQGDFASRVSEGMPFSISPDRSAPSNVRFAIVEWDAAPEMLKGTGWPPSKRLMLLEIAKYGPQALIARFELGQGDPEARRVLFEALKRVGADVGGNSPLYPQWRQLANRIVLKVNEDNWDVEAGAATVLRETRKFLENNVPAYDEAIRPLVR